MENDQKAGRESLDRVLAFSDGVFAIAITILVLNLDVPPGMSPEELGTHLRGLIPSLASAVLSFAVIGRFWIAHRELLAPVRRVGNPGLWLNLLVLGPIVLIPAASQLMAEYGGETVAVVLYALTIAAAGLAELACWSYFSRGLPRERVLRTSADIAIVPAFFLLSVPVAFASPLLAPFCWLGAAIPAGALSSRLRT
ncbi:TMEM175 family protein [Nonomuraea sp. NPDC048826]|uniref:TMEM175 family protein n=1 Tax=Nonomuraea sp. NPDC048826 TaxID=3364347 RepID=UPI0037112E00